MTLTRADETELLTPLHEGMHEEPRWGSFLNRLRGRTRADHAALIFRHGDSPNHEATELSSDRNVLGAGRRLQRHDLHSLGPARYTALRPGRVYTAEEIIDPDDRRHARLRRDDPDALGIAFGRFMRVAEPSGISALVTLTKQADDFGASDSSLLSALAPHLTIALRNFASLEQARFRSAAAEDALARLGVGWAAIDRDGRLIDTNEDFAHKVCAVTGRRPTIGSRLPSGAPDAERTLVEASRAFADDQDSPARIVRIVGDGEFEMLVAPACEHPLTAPVIPALMAFTRRPTPVSALRSRLLARQYGLSAKEADLALALSDGASIEEASLALGLTVETGRHYSKRLFTKTGTRRQADLVRLVLGAVSALA